MPAATAAATGAAAAGPTLKVNGTFVSEKIARVRWIPEQYTAPGAFLTGSWESRSRASIKLWRLTADADYIGDHDNDFDDGSVSQLSSATGLGGGAPSSTNSLLVPRCQAQLPLAGDCTGLEWIDSEHLVCTSGDGFASILHLDRSAQRLAERSTHKRLHRFADGSPAACTGVATYEHSAVTIGEDGAINLLHAADAAVPLRRFGDADSVTLTAVAFCSRSEVFAGNRNGMIKMFDVREHAAMDDDTRGGSAKAPTATRPVATMLIACADEKRPNGVTALAHHPTQRHILLAGSEEGSITVWDLRQMREAASYLTAHETAITELGFHPTAPTRMFTAAEGGELFEWSHVQGGVAQARGPAAEVAADAGGEANPWLSGERIKNKISVSVIRCWGVSAFFRWGHMN